MIRLAQTMKPAGGFFLLLSTKKSKFPLLTEFQLTVVSRIKHNTKMEPILKTFEQKLDISQGFPKIFIKSQKPGQSETV